MTAGELIKLLQEHDEHSVVMLSINDSLDRIKSVEVLEENRMFKSLVINAASFWEE